MPEQFVTAEYTAIRNEILFRLQSQQNIITQTVVVAGFLAPILGLIPVLTSHSVLAALLVGPLVCVFLQLTYLKHHIWLTVDARYLDYEIGRDLSQGPTSALGKRGRYVRDTLHKSKWPRSASAWLGYAEGGLPTLVAGVYLLAFAVIALQSGVFQKPTIYTKFLGVWFVVDFGLSIVAVIAGIRTRNWNLKFGLEKDRELDQEKSTRSQSDVNPTP